MNKDRFGWMDWTDGQRLIHNDSDPHMTFDDKLIDFIMLPD